jgi:hypothetical protein
VLAQPLIQILVHKISAGQGVSIDRHLISQGKKETNDSYNIQAYQQGILKKKKHQDTKTDDKGKKIKMHPRTRLYMQLTVITPLIGLETVSRQDTVLIDLSFLFAKEIKLTSMRIIF